MRSEAYPGRRGAEKKAAAAKQENPFCFSIDSNEPWIRHYCLKPMEQLARAGKNTRERALMHVALAASDLTHIVFFSVLGCHERSTGQHETAYADA